jgi:hypothetical protein
MTKHPLDLSDGEILARLMTRRDIARIGAVTALVAVPTLLVTSGHGRDASAQSTAGTATAEESTIYIYRPATPVGSPQPEPTGPAVETLGPALGEASPVPEVPIESFMDLSLALEPVMHLVRAQRGQGGRHAGRARQRRHSGILPTWSATARNPAPSGGNVRSRRRSARRPSAAATARSRA